jgi:hypothetical protein
MSLIGWPRKPLQEWSAYGLLPSFWTAGLRGAERGALFEERLGPNRLLPIDPKPGAVPPSREDAS